MSKARNVPITHGAVIILKLPQLIDPLHCCLNLIISDLTLWVQDYEVEVSVYHYGIEHPNPSNNTL